MIASYVIDEGGGTGGEGDIFRADEAWRLATFMTIGYLISRGLAKAGSRRTAIRATMAEVFVAP